ncbi:ABC transporter substrate-binding protein [Amnibacterium setariae]|uniref:ABC transporter substrate-binding protein n=1 Tax=Amnibacterium setariae TaxID=2306585 RepID=A0A3A1U7U5_9MICO|nr:ABC transporter substrate-binding protein [Amnibacterium setariae]RIX31118.1 ABC transporter substrate-binding protein [Amnibacterium setariae]
MNHLPARLTAMTATAAAVALIVTGCSSSSGGGQSTSSKTLVVDNAFDLKTSDPARAFELTGSIVDKAIYETALTFNGSDVTKPVPQLTTYTMSDDEKTITLTLNGKHVFSSGNPVTIDDIVWSYKRVQGIAGNPSFLLSNLSTGKPFAITKTSDTTMTITDTQPNPALPTILPNPSLGVLDSKTLEGHGGTTGKDDGAESYLNATSAGSGPYQLSSYNVSSKVVFKPNPKYVGDKPAYGRVVLQNVKGPSQKIDVQGGSAQLALNLNSQQVNGLASGSIKVVKTPSANVGYLWLNQNAGVSGGLTNQPDFVKGVRHAIDYKAIQTIAGSGSTQPGGIVPSQFLGSLESDENNTTDAAAAKSDLAKYQGRSITLSYPTDAALDGVSFADMAQSVQSDLEGAGVKVKLNGLPIATLLDSFRAGKLQAGLMYWGPDFPDPSDYLTFSPGEGLGLRAGWTKDMAPEVTKAKEAAIAAQGDARAAAYQAWQKAANADGAFVPLVQAAKYAVTNGVSGVTQNAIWTVDLATIE